MKINIGERIVMKIIPKGIMAIALAAVLWSTTGVFARYASYSMDPISIAMVKTGIGVIMLLFICGKYAFHTARSNIRSLLLPGIAYGLTATLFILAAVNTTISNTFFLYYSEPAFVIVLSMLFFRQIPTKMLALSAAMVMGGIFILFSPSAGGTLIGNVYALAGGVAYACYILVSKRMSSKHSSGTVTFWSFLLGFAVIVLLAFLSQRTIGISSITTTFPVLLAYSIVDIFGYLLLNSGLKTVDATIGGMILTMEPVIATVFGYMFLAEPLTWLTFAGGILIFSGIITSIIEKKRSSLRFTGLPNK